MTDQQFLQRLRVERDRIQTAIAALEKLEKSAGECAANAKETPVTRYSHFENSCRRVHDGSASNLRLTTH